jgi:hypothetical protein
MLEQSTINIIFILSIIILFLLHFFDTQCVGIDSLNEHLSVGTAASNESLQNIASVYNTGTLIVDNLQVKNSVQIGKDLQVGGKSTLGQWTIYNDRIGIPSRGDINLATDQWVRLYNYGTNDYTGQGGFAGQNLWSSNSVRAPTLSGDVNVSGNITMNGGGVLTDNMAVGIQSSRGGYLVDKGGWTSCNPRKQTNWETMRILKLPVPPNPVVNFSSNC